MTIYRRPTLWHPVFSGATFDWKAEGDASTDPVTGLTVHEVAAGDLAAAAHCDLGIENADEITLDVTSGALVGYGVTLVFEEGTSLLPDVSNASILGIRARLIIENMDVGANDNAISFWIADQDVWNVGATERLQIVMRSGGGSRLPRLVREANNVAGAPSNGAGLAAWNNTPLLLWATETLGDCGGGVYEGTTHTIQDCVRFELDTSHVRAGGANSPYFGLTISAAAGTQRVRVRIQDLRFMLAG